MRPPRGLLAFLGASAGVHLAIVGAIFAVSRTEAPAPLPVIQVDLVQESSGAYRRAVARAVSKGLPVLEARDAARRAAPMNPLPPCGGGLGRGECLDNSRPTLRQVVPTAAAARAVAHASAALGEVRPMPPESRMKPLRCDEPCEAGYLKSPNIASAGPLLRDGASRLLSMRPAGQVTDAPQQRVFESAVHPKVYTSIPHPEEARRAVSKDASTGAVAVPTLSAKEVIQPAASAVTPARRGSMDGARRLAPATEAVKDTRSAELRASPAPCPVQEKASRQVIAAVDSAAPRTVTPPRRKPPRPAADVVAEVKVPREPAPIRPTLIRAGPARLTPAAEVARVLKTLKLKPGAVLKVERGPSPEGANDSRTSAPILAAAVAPGPALGNAAQAANSAPAFQGAALGNAAPRYPYAARVRGIEGDVLLRVVVLPDGKAADVTLRITSGSALLDRAARDAVRGWRFRPAKRAGRTVVGWVDVPVSFRLTD